MIQLRGVNRSFGSQQVLQDINLDIEENKIYGLLGRNGVGKTTMLNIIAAQLRANSGEVLVDNGNPFTSPEARGKVNLVKDTGLGPDLKVKEIFSIGKTFYPYWDEGFKNELVARYKVPLKKNYEKLSRGNKTLVGLIMGLASRSPYTFFDEPSLGLDAANRYDFYKILLEDYEKNPRTIIISTHLIDEVTNLFEEVIILKNTKVEFKSNVSDLMSGYFALRGRIEDVDTLTLGYRVLDSEYFGGSKISYVEGNLTAELKNKCLEKNVDMEDIPLQRLFVLLTGEGENDVR